MFSPADEDYRDQLQSIQSSDSEDDFSDKNKKSPPKEIKELVHVKLSHLHGIISDDEGDEITSPIGSPPAEISALGGRDKFLRLKKKLEEDQAKHFNHEANIQPIVVTDVETLLESFRSERDQSSRSMVSKIEANPKFLELYQQVKDRDHKIIDLEAKLMEQSRKIVDLEDNLNQREQLLTSKNEAVSVVQRKFEAELLLKKEELEKSQRLLFDMERNLGKVQDQWKEDKDRFNSELQKQNEKFNSLESVRFQLTTQMAELQERLVLLQTENSALRQEKEDLLMENKLREEGIEKFVLEQREMAKEKEKLHLAQDLLSREKEILLEDSQQLITEKEQLSKELEDYHREKSEMNETREKLDQERQTFYQELEMIGMEKENLLSEREQFEAEKEEQAANLAEKIKTIEDLKQTVEKYQTNIKKLKLQFQTKLKALKEEKKENDNQERVAELESKITELENKVTELEEEKGNLLLRLVDFDEHQDLNQAKEKLASDQESLERERLNLDLDLETLKQEREQLNSERQRLDDYQSRLNILQQELNGDREALEVEQLNLRHDIKTHNEISNRLIEDKQEFFFILDNHRKERLRLADEKDQIHGDREALKNDQETLAKEWEQFQAEKQANIQLQIQQAAGSGSETDEPESKGQQRSSALSSLSAEREAELTKEIQDLKEALEKSQLNIRKLKIQFQSKLKALREEKKEKEKDVTEKEKDEQQPQTQQQPPSQQLEKITELQNKLAELEEEKGNLLLRVVDFEELQATHESTLAKVSNLELQLSTSEDQLNQLSVQHQLLEANPPLPTLNPQENSAMEQLAKSLSISEDKLSQQSTQLSELSSDKQEKETQIQQLTQEIAILEYTIQEKNEAIKSLEEQIEFNREDFSSAVQDFDRAINKKNEEHKELLASHEAQVSDLNHQISRLGQLVEQYTGQVTQLEKDLEASRLRQQEVEAKLQLHVQVKDSDEEKEKEQQVPEVPVVEVVQQTQAHGQVYQVAVTFSHEDQNQDQVEGSNSGWGDWGNDEDDTPGDPDILGGGNNENDPTPSPAVAEADLDLPRNAGAITTVSCTSANTPQHPPPSSADLDLAALSTLQNENANLKETIEQQSSEILELHEHTQEKNTEIMRLTGEIAELRQTFDMKAKEGAAKSEECEMLKLELAKLSLNLDQVVKSLADSEKTIAEKTLEFLDLSETKIVLSQTIEGSNAKIHELTTIVGELTEKLEETSQTADCKMSELKAIVVEKEELEARVSALKEEVQQLQYSQSQINSNDNQMQNQVETLQLEQASLNLQIETLNSEKLGLKTQLDGLYNEIQNYKTQLESKESELVLYKDQSHDLQQSMVSLHQQISTLQEHVSSLEPLQGEITLLKSHLLEKEEELESFYSQMETSKTKLEELQQSLEKAQSLNMQQESSLQAELSFLKSQLQEKEEELEFTNDQIMSLSVKSGQVDKLTKSLNDIQLVLASKEVEFENYCLEKQNEITSLHQRNAKLNEEFDNEHQKMVDLSEEIYNLQQELKSNDVKNSQDQSVWENMQKSMQDKDAEFSLLLQAKDEEIQKGQSALNALQSYQEEIERLNGELKSKQDELDFTREEMTKLTEALNHVEQVVLKDVQEKEESMKIQVQELTHCVNEKDEEIKKIMADYDEYYNQVRRDLEGKTKAVELLEQQLFEKNEAFLRMEESLRNLKEKHQAEIFTTIEKHNEEEEALFEKISSLTQENTELKSNVQNLQGQLFKLEQELQEFSRKLEEKSAVQVPAQEKIFTQSSFQNAFQNQNPQSFFDNLTPVPIEEEEPQCLALTSASRSDLDDLQAKYEAQKQENYEQEVQITELSITVEELKGQLSELSELKVDLDVVSQENNRLRDQVESVTRELNTLKHERTHQLEKFIQMEAISGPSRTGQNQGQSQGQGDLVEEPCVRATAYVTTDKEVEAPESERDNDPGQGQPGPGLQIQIQQKDQQIAALSNELRELKVKSGRVLQKLRQTTNKYEELQKTYNALKTKSDFSLESAFETEFHDQLQKKDQIIEEKLKLITEIQGDRTRLQNQVDVFERANEKLTEAKENQDRRLEELSIEKRNLKQEIMGLKWRLEELESNTAESAPEGYNLEGVPSAGPPSGEFGSEGQGQGALQGNAYDVAATAQELSSLRIQNAALSHEIGTLQQEINYQRQVVANLQGQLENAVYSMQAVQAQAGQAQLAQQQQIQHQQLTQTQTQTDINLTSLNSIGEIDLGAFGPAKSEQQLLEPQQMEELQREQQQQQHHQLAQEEIVEREILERKIELLQNKISELETNESRYYDDLQKTRSHAQMLDMEVLTYQEIIDDLNRRLNSTERDNLKSKILQEEVNRLILILDEKDSNKCEQSTSELLRLHEEKALLEYQLAAATHNSQLLQQMEVPSEGQSGLALLTLTAEQVTELENKILMLEIDLRREANARRVVQEQLFFRQASKSQNHRLGALVGNSMLSSTTAAAAAAAANASSYGGGSPSRRSPIQPPSPSYSLFTPPGPGSNSPRPSSTSTPIRTPDLRSSPLPSSKLQL